MGCGNDRQLCSGTGGQGSFGIRSGSPGTVRPTLVRVLLRVGMSVPAHPQAMWEGREREIFLRGNLVGLRRRVLSFDEAHGQARHFPSLHVGIVEGHQGMAEAMPSGRGNNVCEIE